MVHALEEIHCLLRPGGCLIDIHPRQAATFFEVHQGGTILFSAPLPDETFQMIGLAENALAQAVERGLFTIEQANDIEERTYASSIAELRDYIVQESGYEDEPSIEVLALQDGELARRLQEALQAGGEGAEITRFSPARMARLRPVKR